VKQDVIRNLITMCDLQSLSCVETACGYPQEKTYDCGCEAALLKVYVDNRLLNASGIRLSFTLPFFS
jgi:hypothetical protein